MWEGKREGKGRERVPLAGADDDGKGPKPLRLHPFVPCMSGTCAQQGKKKATSQPAPKNMPCQRNNWIATSLLLRRCSH